MTERKGLLRSYWTGSKVGWLVDSETGRELSFAVSSVYDSGLARALLRLSWRYAGADLDVGVSCPVAFDYVEADGRRMVMKVRAEGELSLTRPPERHVLYIKSCAQDRNEQGVWYMNTSADTGKPYEPGPPVRTSDVVDPGLLRFINAHAHLGNKYWIALDLPISCVLDRMGRPALICRSGGLPAAAVAPANFDREHELRLFHAWKDMFENGTQHFLAADYLNYESPKKPLGRNVLDMIRAELELMSAAREGARARVILDCYWDRLVNTQTPAEILREYRSQEQESNLNTAAAKMLEAGVCCRLNDLAGVLQRCWDARRNMLGFRLALMEKRYDMAHCFACAWGPRIDDDGVLEELTEIASHTGNAGVLCNGIDNYITSLEEAEEADPDAAIDFSDAFICRCNDALQTLLADCPALEYQMELLRQEGFDDPASMLPVLRELAQTELCRKIPDWDELMREMQTLELPWRSGEDEGAQSRLETNPLMVVRKLTEEIRAGKEPAACEADGCGACEPANGAGEFADLSKRVEACFRPTDPATGKRGGWRLPTDADKGMLGTLKALLGCEHRDVNPYRMPLLIYACMAPAEDVIAAAEAYQVKVQADFDRRKKSAAAVDDRRWKMAEALKRIPGGAEAVPEFEIKADEEPYMKLIRERWRR